MINYEQELDKDQLAAVMSNARRILCVANAGSGKTRTVTYRVAHLLEQGAGESQIMMLTFTKKAAQEMTDRICKLLGKARVNIESGTFHSVGWAYVKSYPEISGVARDTVIAGEGDANDIMNKARSLAIADRATDKYEGVQLEWSKMPKASRLRGVYSKSRNTEKPVLEIIGLAVDEMENIETDGQREAVTAFIMDCINYYESCKQDCKSVDFDDVMILWDKMLMDEGFRGRLQRSVPYIFVDEYQDINPVQARIIKHLVGEDSYLMAVGDDAQCIYGFRGSDISFIRNFMSEFDGAVQYPIRYNYRSTKDVVDVALDVINRSPDYIKNKKQMYSVSEDRAEVRFRVFDYEKEQAEYIARTCKAWITQNHILPSRIAILVRNNRQSNVIDAVFRQYGVPLSVECGIPFYERAHVRRTMNFLKFIMNPQDDVSFLALMNMLPGVGDKTVQKYFGLFSGNGFDFGKLSEFKFPKKSEQSGPVLVKTILSARDALENGDGPKRILEIVQNGWMDNWVDKEYGMTETPKERENRHGDLSFMKEIAKDYTSLADFLSDAALDPAQSDDKKDEPKVRVMTMHKAKGLEFDFVFLAGVSEGIIPCTRQYEDDSLEDDRRLLYVAVTRAAKLLTVCSSMYSVGNERLMRPSSFLDGSNWSFPKRMGR